QDDGPKDDNVVDADFFFFQEEKGKRDYQVESVPGFLQNRSSALGGRGERAGAGTEARPPPREVRKPGGRGGGGSGRALAGPGGIGKAAGREKGSSSVSNSRDAGTLQKNTKY
ncbi:hypothetical protein DP155_25105, partial [Salmonella enterica subsp. enterica serovar Typhimurium]